MNTLIHRLCYRKTYGLSMHFGENDKGLPKGSPLRFVFYEIYAQPNDCRSIAALAPLAAP